jgi:hypothetical protein
MFAFPSRIAVLWMLFLHVDGQIFLAGGHGEASLQLYAADRTTLIDPMANNIIIDLAKTPTVNVKVSAKCLRNRRISSASFFLDGKLLRTDNTAPYWMFGDDGGAWTPTVGNHTITAKAYRQNNGKGRKMLETTTSVIVMDSRTKSPVASPVKAPFPATPAISPAMVIVAPTPVAAPAQVAVPTQDPAPDSVPASAPTPPPKQPPVATPAQSPVSAPMPVSASAPVSSQPEAVTKHPTRSPTKTPSKSPSKAPTKLPTRSPTKVPSKAPTNAPIVNCDENTITYINCITFSNRTLMMSGTTAEDKALQWLVTNDTLKLQPTSVANKTRLRQRFALLTLGLQPSLYPGTLMFQNEKWDLSVADECAWKPAFKCKQGQVTNVAAYKVIAGTLPPDLGWLTAMESFNLQSTDIAGTIPSSIGAWTVIKTMYLDGNSLLGTIPSSIGGWTAIQEMFLHSNKLTGTIPTSIAAWTAIQYMYLDSNILSGSIPPSIGAWTDIRFMDLSFNKLNGTIPSSIGAWTAIRNMYLHGNKLTGTIPLSIGNWTAIIYMSVANNQLNGTVPYTVATWTTSLREAYFDSNNLNGTMPTFGGGFCPKTGTGGDTLSADCPAKILCSCCTNC